MTEIKNRLKSVVDKETWGARGASFVAKAKATKTVWFPPDPGKAGKKGAATAKKTARKGTSTAKKTVRKPTKKATNAAKK